MLRDLFLPQHLLVILVLCVIIFGPKKLPELGKALGDGIRSFRDGMNPNPPAKPEEKSTTEAKS